MISNLHEPLSVAKSLLVLDELLRTLRLSDVVNLAARLLSTPGCSAWIAERDGGEEVLSFVPALDLACNTSLDSTAARAVWRANVAWSGDWVDPRTYRGSRHPWVRYRLMCNMKLPTWAIAE